MVNSGSFESDVDQNEKGNTTQPRRIAESPHSVSSGPVVSGSSCENDFTTQTADSLPVSQAIEPTATKTEYKCNMSSLPLHSSEILASKRVSNSTIANRKMAEVFDSCVTLIGEDECPKPSKDDKEYVLAAKCNLQNKLVSKADEIKTRVSLCCSVPLEKVQNVLMTYRSTSINESNLNTPSKKQIVKKDMCLYCDRTFPTPNLKQKHVERYHSYKYNRRLSARRQTSKSSPTSCFFCDKLNNGEYNLRQLFEHLVTEHPKKYFGCLDCEVRFPNVQIFKNHIITFHENEKEAVSKHHSIEIVLSDEKRNVLENGKTGKPLKSEESKSELKNNIQANNPPAFIKNGQTIKKIRNGYKFKNSVPSEDKKIEDEKGKSFLTPLVALERTLINPDETKEKTSTKKKKLNVVKDSRSKKISGISSKIVAKQCFRITRQQSKTQIEDNKITKKANKAIKNKNGDRTAVSTNYISFQNRPYSAYELAFRIKKITDHSIDNIRISSLTFDDVFDKAFFNKVKCNIQENLSSFIDGKLFKSIESENRISSFQKFKDLQTDETNPQEACSSSTFPTSGCLLSDTHLGEDAESPVDANSKAKKKTVKNDEVHYKYFTRRKYQAIILENKKHRDLSKLDMWTQLAVKTRQQKILCDQKSDKEMIEYKKSAEYKVKLQIEELNTILDKRGPLEDLKEEAMRTVTIEKLNGIGADINAENYLDVSIILNDLLDNLFSKNNFSSILQKKSTNQYTSLNNNCQGNLEVNEKFPNMLNLRRVTTNTATTKSEDGIQDAALVEMAGEWARKKLYICAACGTKVPNAKSLVEHKNLFHEHVWCQHFELVGNQGELYKHLSIPGLGKVGEIETSGSKIWRKSDSRVCTKCNKQFNCLGDLHRHILECGGDWSWLLARKKYKYRHYGSKARKKRRGLLKYLQALRHRKLNKSKENGKPTKKFDGPRPKPSDADTIQRMLANLPAKRRTRKMICLKDGFHRAVKNMNITKMSKNKQVNQNKSQLKSIGSKLKKNKNLKTTRRLLRSTSDDGLENKLNLINIPKLKKNMKEITVANVNLKQNSRKGKNMFVNKKIAKSKKKFQSIPDKVVRDSKLTENENEVVIHNGRALRKKNLGNKLESKLHLNHHKKSRNLTLDVATKKTEYTNSLINENIKNDNKKERNLKETIQNGNNVKKPKTEITSSIKVKQFKKETVQESLDKNLCYNESNMETCKKQKINNINKVTMKNKGIVKTMKSKNQGENIKEQKKNSVITKNLKVRLRKCKSFPFENQITNIIQVDGSSQNNSIKNKNNRKEFNNSKKSVEKMDIKKPFLSQEDKIPIIINPENQKSIDLIKPVLIKSTEPEPPVLTPIDKVNDCNSLEMNKTNQSLNRDEVENKQVINRNASKPKGRKKLKGLNDCIAMLTSKLQRKSVSCLHYSVSNHDDDNTISTLSKEENSSLYQTVPCNNTAMLNPELNAALPETEQMESNYKNSDTLDNVTSNSSSNVLEKVDNNSLENKIFIKSTANKTSLKLSIETQKMSADQNQTTSVEIPNKTTEDTSEDDFTLEDHIPIKHIFCKQIKLYDTEAKQSKGENNDLTENEKHKSDIFFKTLKSKEHKIKKPENNPKRVFEKYVYKKEFKENTTNKNEEANSFNASILLKPVAHTKPRKLNTSDKEQHDKSPLKIIMSPKKVNLENQIRPVIIDETNFGDSEDDNVPLAEFIKKPNDYAEPELVLAQSNDNVQQNEDNLEMPVLLPEVFVEGTDNHVAHKIDITNNHNVEIPIKHKNSKYKKRKKRHIKEKKTKNKLEIDTTKQDNNINLIVNTINDKVTESTVEQSNDLKDNESCHNNTYAPIVFKNPESESILCFSEESVVACDTTINEDVTTETIEDKIIAISPKKEEINSNSQNIIENENSRSNKENENTQTIKINNQNEYIKRTTKRNIKTRHKRKSKTTRSEAVIDKNLTNVYCDICNKTFTRTENLLKHKRTLTHIAKLSEIEAQEAAEKIAEHSITEETENSQVSKLSTVQDEFSDLDNDSNDKYLSSLSRFPLTTSSQNGLKLVDIISDVLSKPIENTFSNKHSSFTDLILPPSNYNVQHCSNLEERNGFKSDKLLLYSDHHLISHISTAADVIVEKQISLLENMIEDNHNNMKRSEKIPVSSNHSTNEEYSRQSNSSEFSVGTSKAEDCNDITFSHNTNIINNLIKPTLDGVHLIRSAQYEAISEDSSSSHFQIEEQKSRKILNRDEELFLECCSLLKSSSEVSDFCKKPARPHPFLNGFNLKSFDDLDWFQNKNIGSKKLNDFESASSNFTSEDSHMNPSVSDQFYHNLPYANSDASLNYNLNLKTMFARNGNETVFSQPPIFEDISRESEDMPARFFGSSLKTSPLNLAIDQYDKGNDCVSPNVESAQIPEDQDEAIEEISEAASDAGNLNEIVGDINEMCNDINKQMVAVETDVSERADAKIVDVRFEREEEVLDMRHSREEEVLDMRHSREEVLHVRHSKEEVLHLKPANEEILDIRLASEEEALDLSPAREEVLNQRSPSYDEEKVFDILPASSESDIIEKPVSKMIQPQITNYTTTEKKVEEHNTFIEEESSKEFEELKVSIPKDGLNMKKILNCSPASKWLEIKAFEKLINPNKKVSKRSHSNNKLGYKDNKLGFKEIKKRHLSHMKTHKTNSDNSEKKCHDVYDFEETQDSLDLFYNHSDNFPVYRSFRNKISEDSESENKSRDVDENDEQLPDELSTSKKINGVKSITKKKCMIMGRIFKNALKSKMADEIKNIPTIDNKKNVEDYVMNCPSVPIQNNNCNTVQRLSEEEMNTIFDSLLNNENPVPRKCENEIETFSEQELKSKQKGIRSKKKLRGSSPTSSDEEFSIKVPKRQCTKNKVDNNQCVINLEQELKECIGVASRKSQRKCTSGKQNVLVEYWSSDDSNLGIEDSEAVLNINGNTDTSSFTIINNPSSVQSSSSDNIKDAKDSSKINIEVNNKKEETDLPVIKSTTEVEKIKPVKQKSGVNKSKKSLKTENKLQNVNVDLESNAQTIASTRKKRNAVDTLYYWSSSSEDEFQDVIEIKSSREEYEDEDRPLQHGWIVGDSPKKLVTMLAQAKGKKLEVESVKKNKKKRIGV